MQGKIHKGIAPCVVQLCCWHCMEVTDSCAVDSQESLPFLQEHDKFQHLQRSKEKKEEEESEPVKPALQTAMADGVAQGGHGTSGSHIGRWPGSITGTPTWAAYSPYSSLFVALPQPVGAPVSQRSSNRSNAGAKSLWLQR